MKFFINFLDFFISIILALLINYYITSEAISILFQGAIEIFNIVIYLSIAIQILFVFAIIKLIRYKSLNKTSYNSLCILYFIMLFVLLFGRYSSTTSINLNILGLFSREAFMQNILNTIFFIPLGNIIYEKNIIYKSFLLIPFCGIILIETIQLISKRGIFDICDIILNVLGLTIGYFISKNIGVKITENIINK